MRFEVRSLVSKREENEKNKKERVGNIFFLSYEQIQKYLYDHTKSSKYVDSLITLFDRVKTIKITSKDDLTFK